MESFNMWESNIVLFVQENLRFEFLDPIMKFITSLGDEGIVPIALCILLIIFKKTRKGGVYIFIGLFVSLVINDLILKNIITKFRFIKIFNTCSFKCFYL